MIGKCFSVRREYVGLLPAIDENLSIVLDGVSEDSERTCLELLLLLLLSLLGGQLLLASHCNLFVFCKLRDADKSVLVEINN